MRSSSRTVTLGLGTACCTGMLCAHGVPEPALEPKLRGGGRELVLRGAALDGSLTSLIAMARRAGFAKVVVTTAGLDRADPEVLAKCGVSAYRAVLFSHVPAVHDRLAGRPDALVRTLVAMRALARAGIPIELEVPLIALRLSDPRQVVALALRAIEDLAVVRFVVPFAEVPASLAPPPFDRLAPALREAVTRAADAGAEVRFDPSQGLPPCALGDDPAMHPRFEFRARERSRRVLPSTCGPCALAPSCVGPTPAYRAANGARGLAPFPSRPETLRGRRANPRPRWGPAEREAARHVRFLVLRPTVHCNQDCLFCSANESSGNAFGDPKVMLKAIARAAQRGVRRISFSGGEPTLSPHLPSFVLAAKRCGVREIELVTNGVLLDRADKVQRLVDRGLTHAFVSLHAHSEALSRTLTQKEGDHARTLQAIEHLLASGVLVAVNHVITARNLAYLKVFIEAMHARFEGRVLVSFAFLTPQYKALEHPELWPRLAETRPHLLHAMARAVELGQPFVVGARQGVPPCVLGPFAPWSDIFETTAEAASEDAPQKSQAPACARCRHRRICTGLWRPYAARFGYDELAPIEGEPFTDEELAAIRALHRKPPWGVPNSFEDAPPMVRDRVAERAPLPVLPVAKVSLPVHRPTRTRPLRVLLLGSGGRARQLAERAAPIEGWAWAGVASPHAPEASGWDPLPVFRDARVALDAVRPDAALIAAATEAHVELAQACAEAGVPVLLEKPVARTSAEARGLNGWISVASQELFASGLEALAETRGVLSIVWRVPPEATAAPRSWSPAALRETLHHALSFAVRGRGAPLEVLAAQHEGGGRPERIRLRLGMARGEVEVRLDFTAREASLAVDAEGFAWRRDARGGVTREGASVRAEGSDEERMLRAFRLAVASRAEPPVSVEEGVRTLEAVEAGLDALASAGAPLVRKGAPKHVASDRYRIGGSRR